jgi:hypothetical protein
MKESRRAVAFVVHHAYSDALACYREPMRYYADAGWQVDLYIGISAQHPAPTFTQGNVRICPIEVSHFGAARLVAQLTSRRHRYAVIFCAPSWGLYWATRASALTGTPVAYISDELMVDAELLTASQRRWKARERAAHRRCAFTIALSAERADYLRRLNRLPDDHPIFVVPNAAPGPAHRVSSRYYRDYLALPDERPVALHAGGMGWAPLTELIAEAEGWAESRAPILVCQGRLPSQMAGRVARGSARYATESLPSGLLDYAVSSADVGLALYDDRKENDRLMGTASGKLCLYLKNGLPVVTTRLPCFAWIEDHRCGIRASTVREIRGAIDAAYANRAELEVHALRYYDAHLDFRSTFRPVAAFVEELAAGAVTGSWVRASTAAPAAQT